MPSGLARLGGHAVNERQRAVGDVAVRRWRAGKVLDIPNAMTRSELAEATGLEATGGGSGRPQLVPAMRLMRQSPIKVGAR
jgi:hypothetical protein